MQQSDIDLTYLLIVERELTVVDEAESLIALLDDSVNIYKIGDTMLDERDVLEQYAEVAYKSMPGVYVRPFGRKPGFTDDHLHIDFGYVIAVPRGAPFETYNPKVAVEPL